VTGALPLDRRAVLAGAAALPALGMAPAGAQAAALSRDRRTLPLERGWRFHRGAGTGFEAVDFDDVDWREVDLPHDWGVEDLPPGEGRIGPFDPAAPGGLDSGFTVGGEGWYRRVFRVDPAGPEARFELMFEGVSVECEVWVNGRSVGRHVHPFAPFGFDITPHVDRSGDNVLAVRVRNIGSNSRWYYGSGLYRRVWIEVRPGPARIARWGVATWTSAITAEGASLLVCSTLEGMTPDLRLHTRLLDARGGVVVQDLTTAQSEVVQKLNVPRPRLWSPREPNLYRLEVTLVRGEEALDRAVLPIGLRIVTIDAAEGLRINGEPYKLRGGCVHHDNGLLGAAAFPDAEDRKIRLLKARGFNAIRAAHNPTSASFRDACDRHGMLLIEEAFDMWHHAKRPNDYAQHFRSHWRDDLTAMVLSARNNACVIMWSIGNEIPDRNSPTGVAFAWALSNHVRALDPTRPVTAGLNDWPGRPVIADEGTARRGTAGKPDLTSNIFLDVVGYNYRLKQIPEDHWRFPDRVFFASESFPKDSFDYWRLGEEAPYMLGEFVWAAMDYLGEAGTGLGAHVPAGQVPLYYEHRYPVVNSYEGDIDLIGHQKPQSRVRDVVWGLSPLEVGVQSPVPAGQDEYVSLWGWSDEWPEWTFPGHEGRPLAVRIYTVGDRVEVRLNGARIAGKTLGPADRLRTEVVVPYAPGELEVIAWSGSKEIGRRHLATTGKAARIVAHPEAGRRPARRDALHYVPVELLDQHGRVVSTDDRTLHLAVVGPAELVGFGNASAAATGSLRAPVARTHRGRALAILRSTGVPGAVKLRLSGEALATAAVDLVFGSLV